MLIRIGLVVVLVLALPTSFARAQEEAVTVIPDKPAGVVGEKPEVVDRERPQAAQEQPEAAATDSTELQKVNAACRIILDSSKADDTAKANATKWGECVKTRQWGNMKARYVGMGKNADGTWYVRLQDFKGEKAEVLYNKLDPANQQVLRDIWQLKFSIAKYAEQPEIVAEAKALEESRATARANAAKAAEERKKQLVNKRTLGGTKSRHHATNVRNQRTLSGQGQEIPWEKNKDAELEVFKSMNEGMLPAIKSTISAYTPQQKAKTLENAIWLFVNLTPKLDEKTIIAKNGLKSTIPAPRAFDNAALIGGCLSCDKDDTLNDLSSQPQTLQTLSMVRFSETDPVHFAGGAWLTSKEGKFPAELDANQQQKIIPAFGLCAYVPILHGGTTGAYWAKKLAVPLYTPNFNDGSVLHLSDAVKIDAGFPTPSQIEKAKEFGEYKSWHGWDYSADGDRIAKYNKFKDDFIEDSHHPSDFNRSAVAALFRRYVRQVIEEIEPNRLKDDAVFAKMRSGVPVRVEGGQPDAQTLQPSAGNTQVSEPHMTYKHWNVFCTNCSYKDSGVCQYRDGIETGASDGGPRCRGGETCTHCNKGKLVVQWRD